MVRLSTFLTFSVLLLLLLPPLLPISSANVVRQDPTAAFARVNQVGYEPNATKIAYLLSSGSETGATFQVEMQSGTVVFSAPLGAMLGPWNVNFPYVYSLNLTSVRSVGDYRISVNGPIPATSPSFRIDTEANLYSGLLTNSLLFFEAQRDGRGVISSVMSRQPSHLNDESATVYYPPSYAGEFPNEVLQGPPVQVQGAGPVNASGGWFDAGDYLKFVETTSYVEDMFLLGIRDFPGLLGHGSKSSDFTAEARFGLDWLQKMWDDKTLTLYYQVGLDSGNSTILGDHDLGMRLPQADDNWDSTNPAAAYIRHRPVLRAGPPGSPISPNLAGRLAAAFALCFQVYRTTDPSYAKACLLSAEHIFGLADTNPASLVTASAHGLYPENEWRDDLEFGASELYFALSSGNLPPGLPQTDPIYYLHQAALWANAYITGPNDGADTLGVGDVSGLAHYELYRAIALAGQPGGLAVSQTDLLADMKKQLDGAVAIASTNPFQAGIQFYWGSITGLQGLAIVAREYDQLTGTKTHADFRQNQLDLILGANGWGTSFIVGDGAIFPHCIHHQIANLVGSLNGSPPILKGAVAGGPSQPLSASQIASQLPAGARTCPPTAAIHSPSLTLRRRSTRTPWQRSSLWNQQSTTRPVRP